MTTLWWRSGASGTDFLEPSDTPWYPGATVKDSFLNLLVFLLVFAAAAVCALTFYGLAYSLIPGGRGLVFSNPYAAALVPSLMTGLLVAQYRAVHRPGRFPVTWALLAAAFLLLLTLPIPLIQQTPPLRASDSSPLVPGRFLPLSDGSLLLSAGNASLLVPPEAGDTMGVSAQTQYDPLNQRFVFSAWDPKALGNSGPERGYYQFTPALESLQKDLLALYLVLRNSSDQAPLVFWFQAAAVTWLFLGFFFFFSIKTWPLVHVVLLLLLSRLALIFLVYAFWSVPPLVDLWTQGPVRDWMRVWAPIGLVGVAAATLFFMTWLTKPHRRTALS